MSSPADTARNAQEDSPPNDREPLEPPFGEGDDDHVILWMLSLTPTQRLEVAQGFAEGVLMIRHGLRA
jgi:hypothetical protein